MKAIPLLVLILAAGCFIPSVEAQYCVAAGHCVDLFDSLSLLERLCVCLGCIAAISGLAAARGSR